MDKYLVPTWICSVCGFTQDFEPTAENIKKHFGKRFRDYRSLKIGDNDCIACSSGLNDDKIVRKENRTMAVQKSKKNKTVVSVPKEEDLGEVFIEEDVFEPSERKFVPIKRKLSNTEKSELITKIKNDRDYFSKIGELMKDPVDDIKI